MLAAVVRSGVVEAVHEGAVAVVAPGGELLCHSGDIDRPFFGRSAMKPFQAQVGLELGSGLDRARLAIACASHPGTPAHVAFVRDVLRTRDIAEAALQTPPDRPLSPDALQMMDPAEPPRPVFHNCSGKHAAKLVACQVAGFDLDTYLEPGHPLQKGIKEMIGDVTGADPGEPGIDGCGSPVYATSARQVARAFAALATETRFSRVKSAMHSHPRLIGDPAWTDVMVMERVYAVAKGGAEGLVGIGLPAGFGIAIKAWDGALRGLRAAALHVLFELRFLDARAVALLWEPVLGGGRPAGRVEPRLRLQWT